MAVLVLVAGSLFMSGCEGMNPAADFMKVAAEKEKNDADREQEEKFTKMEYAERAQIRQDEKDKDALDRNAEILKGQAANDPNNKSGSITVGTGTSEKTKSVSTGDSSVGSSKKSDPNLKKTGK